MIRLNGLLLAPLLLFVSNTQAQVQTQVQAQGQCTVWGEFSNVAETQTTTLGETNRSQFTINAELIYRTLLVEEKHHWVGMQLHQAELNIDGERSRSLVYSVPMAVKIESATGEVLDYRFAARLESKDKSKLMAVFRTLHLKQWPASVMDKHYIAREKDDIGEYKMEYRKLSNGQLNRSKLEYLKSDDKNMASKLFKLDKITVYDDDYVFTKGNCWHRQVDGESDIKVASSDGSVVVHSKSELDMKLSDKPLPKNALLLTLAEDPKKWKKISEDLIYPRPERVPLKDKVAFIKAFNAMDLLAMDQDLVLQFLYDNEVYLSEIKALLQTGQLSDKEQMRLFMLLGKNDSPQTHAILIEIFSDEEFSPDQRFRGLMALKNCKKPIDVDRVDKLFSYANDSSLEGENRHLSHTAILVMGGVARNQKDSDFGQYLSERLTNNLQSAQTDAEVGLLLTALGNSANENNQDIIASYLDNDNPDVRSKAAAALGKVPNDQTLAYLTSQLPMEKDSATQSAILKSMGANELNQQQVNTVYSYAANSDDATVRSAAIDVLGKQAGSNGSVNTKLQSLKSTETSYNNLRKIMKSLYKR